MRGIEVWARRPPLAGKVAALLCEMTGAERVAFTNNGLGSGAGGGSPGTNGDGPHAHRHDGRISRHQRRGARARGDG